MKQQTYISAIVGASTLLVLSACQNSTAVTNTEIDVSATSSLSSINTDAQSAPNIDTRKLITVKEPITYGGMYGYDPYFSSLNEDAPTEYVPYTNAKYGVSLELPYNPQWGSPDYRIPPYEEWVNGEGVLFGPVTPCEGADCRSAHFAFSKPEAPEEIISRLKNEGDTDISQKTIGNQTVIQFTVEGDEMRGPYSIVLISGKNATIRVYPGVSGKPVPGDFEKELERIIQSIREN